jgi:DNA mismatch repair protein MutH
VGSVPYKFPVDEEKISKIVDIMAGLTAVEIPAQTFDGTGLEKNSIIVQATGDGIDNTIMIGDANADGLYFAKSSRNDNIYLVSKENRDELDQRIRDLK